jgi:hypothetical protein
VGIKFPNANLLELLAVLTDIMWKNTQRLKKEKQARCSS